MDKRTRLETTLSGEIPDQTPVSFWRHWQGDDQRAADLARATIDFQQRFDWDFSVVVPSNTYSVMDYGITDRWDSSLDGRRTITRHIIEKSLQWTELRPNDPMRGTMGKYLEAVRLVANQLSAENIPVLAVIYSPLAQASRISGENYLIRSLRTRADRLRTGLNTLTESTLRLLEALRQTNIDGIVYVVEHANFSCLTPGEYQEFGVTYDRKIVDMIVNRWWFNILQLHGDSPMFEIMSTYPAQVISWNSQDTKPDLSIARNLFNGTLCTGLSPETHMHRGTPSIIKLAANEAMSTMNQRRLILSAGGHVPITTPISNLQAVCDAVSTKTGLN